MIFYISNCLLTEGREGPKAIVKENISNVKSPPSQHGVGEQELSSTLQSAANGWNLGCEMGYLYARNPRVIHSSTV